MAQSPMLQPHQATWAGAIGATLLAFYPSPTLAQIAGDGTVGTQVNGAAISPCTGVCTIDGGTVRGVNLFHSFERFSVPTDGEAYFNNGAPIQNILTRVTGNLGSTIDGLLRTNGTANLYFLNPNGIVFGPNARLQVGGSFVATTASSFKFPDGSEFSAVNPQAPPLLAVSLTPGLQYGGNNTATITNRGNLAVGQDLTLAAGNLNLQGQLQAGGDLTLRALDTVQVRDSVTTPLIAAAGGKLLVQGDRTIDIFALNHPNSGFFAGRDLIVRSATAIQSDAHFTSGGNFRIEQLDGTPGRFFSPNDPVIRANGNVTFTDYVGASLHIFAGGSVTANSIIINAPDSAANSINEVVTLSDGTSLAIQGASVPTLDIRAGTIAVGTPEFTPNPPLGFTPPLPTTNGSPLTGDISVNQITLQQPNGLVYLTNQYQPNTTLPGGTITVGTIVAEDVAGGFIGQGNSGSVVMDSRNNIAITNSIDTSTSSGDAGAVKLLANSTVSLSNSSIFTDTTSDGKGGDIRINTGSLILANRAQLLANTSGQGNAGNISIGARDVVSLDTSYINASTEINTSTDRPGQGGRIEINTGSLSLTNGSQLLASTASKGNGGTVVVNARDIVSLDGIVPGTTNITSAIFTNTVSEGNGGSIEINTDSLSFTNGGQLSSATSGKGNGGTITINARNQFSLDGVAPGTTAVTSAIYARTEGQGSGRAGNIQINAGSLSLANGAQFSIGTAGTGDAGNLTITVQDTFSMDGVAPGTRIASGILAGVGDIGSGRAGTAQITARSVWFTKGGSIVAPADRQGPSGTVEIRASDSVNIIGTSPTAGISSGITIFTGSDQPGGRIKIDTKALRVVDGGVIDARTFGSGTGGNIELSVDALEITNGGQIFTTTASNAQSGKIVVNADRVSISGFDSTYSDRLARFGRDIFFPSFQLQPTTVSNISGFSGLFALSTGSGIAGGIDLNVRSIQMDRQGRISVESGSSQGGNISLQVRDLLLMRRGSLISATSGLSAGSEGDGGNITINAPRGFLVSAPRENNDILSNSFSSRGGRIEVNAKGVFWFDFRSRNDLVQLLGTNDPDQLDPQRLQTNDITAVSRGNPLLNGDVLIRDDSKPTVLSTLPTLVDPTNQIDQRCTSDEATNSFTVTGRGGIPLNPDEPLESRAVVTQWVTLPEAVGGTGERGRQGKQGKQGEQGEQESGRDLKIQNAIVEAQGWVVEPDGTIELVANGAMGDRANILTASVPCQTAEGH